MASLEIDVHYWTARTVTDSVNFKEKYIQLLYKLATYLATKFIELVWMPKIFQFFKSETIIRFHKVSHTSSSHNDNTTFINFNVNNEWRIFIQLPMEFYGNYYVEKEICRVSAWHTYRCRIFSYPSNLKMFTWKSHRNSSAR